MPSLQRLGSETGNGSTGMLTTQDDVAVVEGTYTSGKRRKRTGDVSSGATVASCAWPERSGIDPSSITVAWCALLHPDQKA